MKSIKFSSVMEYLAKNHQMVALLKFLILLLMVQMVMVHLILTSQVI